MKKERKSDNSTVVYDDRDLKGARYLGVNFATMQVSDYTRNINYNS